MPFTQEQFFDVFRVYNTAVFPWQVVLHAIAIIAAMWLGFAHALKREMLAGPLMGGLLAVLWAWAGAVYHLAFFYQINPAASLFGAAFLIQALGFLVVLVFRRPPRFPHPSLSRQLLGAILLVIGLMVYPVLNGVVGHEFMASPTFGTPCPTTIFTLGILVLARNVHWALWIIPIGWSALGGSAALLLRVPQDYVLLLAGLFALAVLVIARNEHHV